MILTLDASQIEKLAPMPASLAPLASLMNQEDAPLDEMVRLIELDEVLTVNVLKAANSVGSRAHAKIGTVRDAVVGLGPAEIFNLAVGRQIAGPMIHSCPGYELTEHELWCHSVAAAMAAKQMESFATKPVPKLAFTAALMHDVGKILLGRLHGHDKLEEIRKLVEMERLNYLEAEKRVMGTDHAIIGGEIARHWNFPKALVRAIRDHHNPDVRPNPLLDVVHLANAAAKLVGVGLGIEEMNMHVSKKAPRRMGITFENFKTICTMVRTDLAEAERRFMA
jgi:putative nucleotidyltransferase with HDIG domain